jgi:hypothetical protein
MTLAEYALWAYEGCWLHIPESPIGENENLIDALAVVGRSDAGALRRCADHIERLVADDAENVAASVSFLHDIADALEQAIPAARAGRLDTLPHPDTFRARAEALDRQGGLEYRGKPSGNPALAAMAG